MYIYTFLSGYKMRTYGPRSKSPQYMYIPNVADRCRLCLAYSTSLIPIFDESNTLVPRIFICVSVLLNQNESLPRSICSNCLSELNKYYEFKKKCTANDSKLKKYLNLVELEKNSCSNNNKEKLHMNVLKNHERIEYFNNKVSCAQDNTPKTSETKQIENHLGKLVSAALKWNNKQRHPQVLNTNVFPGVSDGTGDVEIGEFKTVHVYTKDEGVVTLELEEELSEDTKKELSPDVSIQKTQDESWNLPFVLKDFQENIPDNASNQTITGVACKVCDRWFDSVDALSRHVSTHTAERPFECDSCGVAFRDKSVLTRHLLTHLDKRPYACNTCNKSYTQESGLKSHLRSHEPPSLRPLALTACPMCGKTFCHRSGLTRHMKSHTNQLFVCRVCGRTFTDQSSMRRHRLTMHAANTGAIVNNKNVRVT